VAREYNVPVDAVLEAIDYSVKNKDLLDAERAREDALIKTAGRDKWPYAACHRAYQIMNLYLDDDSVKGALVARLRKAGHHVVVPADAYLAGAADTRHFLHAVRHGLVLLTKNHDDFEDLHLLIQATHGRHTGIVAIRFR